MKDTEILLSVPINLAAVPKKGSTGRLLRAVTKQVRASYEKVAKERMLETEDEEIVETFMQGPGLGDASLVMGGLGRPHASSKFLRMMRQALPPICQIEEDVFGEDILELEEERPRVETERHKFRESSWMSARF